MLKSVLVISLLVLGAADLAGPRPSNAKWKADQKKAADSAAAGAADDAKMAAVNKVVSMLEDLQAQVLAEGEAEAIKTGKDDKESLTADIKKFSKQRDDLDKKISRLKDAIKKAEDEIEKTTKESDA